MGCDIHCTIEVKKDGIWQVHAPFIKNKWYRPQDKQTEWNSPEVQDKGFDDRNYALFSVLAGVRNYDTFTPISEPRGLPDDVSAEAQKASDDYGVDGHSHSWLTLTELLGNDWDAPVQMSGLVTEAIYKEWDRKSYPEMYCRGDGGGNTVLISQDDYEDAKLSHTLDPNKNYYIKAAWDIPLREAVGESAMQDIERLKNYADQFGGPDNVRVVFFFDLHA